MTIFEEYLSSKKEENKVEMDYLWDFYDYQNNVTNILKAKTKLKNCKETLKQLDEVSKKK